MKSKVVLDTSFLSSLLIEDDDNYSKALLIYKTQIINSDIIIPMQAKAELFVMKRDLAPLDKIIRFLNLFNYKTDFINAKQELQLIDFIEKYDPSLKSGDLMILFSAFNNEAELITFDKKLKQEFQRIMI